MKKILIVGNGGIAKDEKGLWFANHDTEDFLLNLKKSGYQITYVSQRGDYFTNKFLYDFDLKKNGINFFCIKGNRRNPLRYLGILKLFLKIFLNDHIYVYYFGSLTNVSARISFLLKKPYGVYVRGYGENLSNKDKKIFLRARYLTTVAPKIKNDLIGYCQNIYVIRPMLDWGIEQINKKRKKFLNILNWNLLFVGSITKRKGILELLSAIEIIEEKNISFTIIGDGPLLSRLKDKYKDFKNINFVGGISDRNILKDYYSKADLFILPTHSEGFPRVYYEAMIYQLPILTTMVSGIPLTLKGGFNCIEIPIKDPNGICEVIIKTINTPHDLSFIVRNGTETVKRILTEREKHHTVLINAIEDINK